MDRSIANAGEQIDQAIELIVCVGRKLVLQGQHLGVLLPIR